MSSLNKALQLSKELKVEADRLLTETRLEELLKNYGLVELGGSYRYDLLVDRDLDFRVAVDKITPQLRSEIVATFARQPWAYTVNMTDRLNFEPLSNLQAPRGLYIGLTVPFPIERWNIDIWFIVGDNLPHNQLDEKVVNAPLELKNIILQIKYEQMISDQKLKGITSAQIYEAVLDKGIKTTSDFMKLLDY